MNDIILENIKYMLYQRGYLGNIIEKKDESIWIISKTVEENLLLYDSYLPKINIEVLRYVLKKMQSNNITHGIILYQNGITPSFQKGVEYMTNYRIEYFCIKEFEFRMTDLYYYCPHEKIKDKQKEIQIKEMYGIQNIPILLKMDPICRYFGFMRGDVIQILRKDNTLAYRIVK